MKVLELDPGRARPLGGRRRPRGVDRHDAWTGSSSRTDDYTIVLFSTWAGRSRWSSCTTAAPSGRSYLMSLKSLLETGTGAPTRATSRSATGTDSRCHRGHPQATGLTHGCRITDPGSSPVGRPRRRSLGYPGGASAWRALSSGLAEDEAPEVASASQTHGPLDFSSSRPRAQPCFRGTLPRRDRVLGCLRRDKQALVQPQASPFFTTAQFEGHPSCCCGPSRTGELSREELAEVVQDAWLSRASARRATAWLTVSYNKLLIALLLLALGAGLALVGPRRALWSRQLLGGAALALSSDFAEPRPPGHARLAPAHHGGGPRQEQRRRGPGDDVALPGADAGPAARARTGRRYGFPVSTAGTTRCTTWAAAGRGDHRHRGRRAAAVGERRVRLVHGHGEAGQPGRGRQRGAGAPIALCRNPAAPWRSIWPRFTAPGLSRHLTRRASGEPYRADDTTAAARLACRDDRPAHG